MQLCALCCYGAAFKSSRTAWWYSRPTHAFCDVTCCISLPLLARLAETCDWGCGFAKTVQCMQISMSGYVTGGVHQSQLTSSTPGHHAPTSVLCPTHAILLHLKWSAKAAVCQSWPERASVPYKADSVMLLVGWIMASSHHTSCLPSSAGHIPGQVDLLHILVRVELQVMALNGLPTRAVQGAVQECALQRASRKR